eukprot:COSAG06_NODE_55049_length_291_cov_1.104167_1_plen_51_part_10
MDLFPTREQCIVHLFIDRRLRFSEAGSSDAGAVNVGQVTIYIVVQELYNIV